MPAGANALEQTTDPHQALLVKSIHPFRKLAGPVVLLVLFGTGQGCGKKKTTLEQGPLPALLSAAQLEEAQDREDVVLIDTRPATEFPTGHLPEAILLPLEDFHPGPGNLDGYTRNRLVEHLAAAGITKGFSVVVIDQGQFKGLGRAGAACWALSLVGITDCSILEGGVPGWVRAGFNLSRENPITLPPVPPLAVPDRPPTFASFEDARKLVLEWSGALIDMRIARAEGSIPGTHRMNLTDLLTETGTIDRGALEHQAGMLGLFNEPDLVVLGEGPEDGALGWFLLYRVLGISSARLFPGGFNLWKTDPLLPGATANPPDLLPEKPPPAPPPPKRSQAKKRKPGH